MPIKCRPSIELKLLFVTQFDIRPQTYFSRISFALLIMCCGNFTLDPDRYITPSVTLLALIVALMYHNSDRNLL